MIFPNEESRILYMHQQPNDQLQGRNSAWARLYLESEGGGSIVVQQQDGGIDHYVYTSDVEINDAWQAFERQMEIGQPDLAADHCIFPLWGQWAWTRPDADALPNAKSCLMTVFDTKEHAIQTMCSLYDDLREYWLVVEGEWRLTEAPY